VEKKKSGVNKGKQGKGSVRLFLLRKRGLRKDSSFLKKRGEGLDVASSPGGNKSPIRRDACRAL